MCFVIIGGLTDEAQGIQSQTTIGLHTNDYWFEGQTTIRLYPKQLLKQTQTTTASLHLLAKPDLYTFTKARKAQGKSSIILQPNDLIADIRLGLSSYLSSAAHSAKTSHTRARRSTTCGSIYAPYIKKLSKYPHGNTPSYR